MSSFMNVFLVFLPALLLLVFLFFRQNKSRLLKARKEYYAAFIDHFGTANVDLCGRGPEDHLESLESVFVEKFNLMANGNRDIRISHLEKSGMDYLVIKDHLKQTRRLLFFLLVGALLFVSIIVFLVFGI